jgi:glycosyltransferase involved in cell wall biosynthesis
VNSSGPHHLAILTPTFARGGSEEYVIALARWAVERRWPVTVCVPDVPGVASLRDELLHGGVSIAEITASPEFVFSDVLFLRHRSHAVHTFRARGFDRMVIVLPSIEWGGPFIDAAAHCDIPTAIVYQLVGYPYLFTHLEKASYTWARRQRQVWATVSAQNREVLCASLGWAHDAIDVVPNALLRPLVPPAPADRAAARAAVRREIGAPDHAFVVLTVARLDLQKAFDVLLDAAALVSAASPHVHFVWVGDGGAHAIAANLVDAKQLKDKVHLLGRRTDVPHYLRAADAFVLPSRFEGSPFAALEAMAMGLPTVLSDIGPHREIARDCVEALFVPMNDPAAIAAQIARLLADDALRDRLHRAARQRSLEFSPTTSFRRLFALLDQTITGERTHRPMWPLPEPTTTRRRIAIYGAGAGGQRAYAERLPGVDVVAFLDARANGSHLLGVPVLRPEAVRDLDVDRVVVASRHHGPAMVETLRAAGCPDEKIEIFSLLRLIDPGEAEVP